MATVDVHEGWQPEITLGLRLRALRRELGRRRGKPIGQKEMADFLNVGVGSKAYGAWETDRNSPDGETIAAIAERTGCDREWLAFGPGNGGAELQIKSLLLWPVELAALGQGTPAGQMAFATAA